MKEITLPLSQKDCLNLHAGEMVWLNGTMYTARDAAHKRMDACLQNNETLPFPIKDGCIYYVGPTEAKANRCIGSCGPTTSSRMDVYTPALYDLGLKATIGKGYRSQAVLDAIVRNQAVYFVAMGGLGALLSECVSSSEVIAYPELGTEAIRKLTVHHFPVIVGIDCMGHCVYDE